MAELCLGLGNHPAGEAEARERRGGRRAGRRSARPVEIAADLGGACADMRTSKSNFSRK